MMEWMNGSFTKIIVGCNSEEELFDLQKQAKEACIVNAIIKDEGNTEFKMVCSDCDGTGGIAVIDITGDHVVKKCLICKGTGKLNKPTYTALAIGPYYSKKIDDITKDLNLL